MNPTTMNDLVKVTAQRMDSAMELAMQLIDEPTDRVAFAHIVLCEFFKAVVKMTCLQLEEKHGKEIPFNIIAANVLNVMVETTLPDELKKAISEIAEYKSLKKKKDGKT